MPYANPFLRLVFGGSLYDVEDWSASLSLIEEEPGGAHPDYPETVPAGVISACTAMIQTTKTSSAAKLKWIKLNPIGTDGKYMTLQTVRHDYVTPISGSGGSGVFPQIALAVSLMTPFARGRAHAGRFYLPAPDLVASTGGLIGTSDAGIVAGQATTFLNALNSALSGFRVGIVSNLDDGVEREVTHVRVGQVADTIRSRRNKLLETYSVGSQLAGA